MKKKVFSVTLITTILFFMSCSTAQISKRVPFEINNAYFQKWNDTKSHKKGKLVVLKLRSLPKSVVLDSVYFDGKKDKLKVSKDNRLVFVSKFEDITYHDKDLILHSDPKKEFGNKPPVKLEKIPFELSDNECIISYFHRSKKKYFKLVLSQK